MDEYDDEGGSRRAVAQGATVTHLTSVFSALKSRVELHKND
jgi:hypothetical protein